MQASENEAYFDVSSPPRFRNRSDLLFMNLLEALGLLEVRLRLPPIDPDSEQAELPEVLVAIQMHGCKRLFGKGSVMA